MNTAARLSMLCIYASLGGCLGWAHLRLLGFYVRTLVGDEKSTPRLVASFARLPLVVATFVFAALHGAPALLALLAGFVCAGTVLLRTDREARR